MSYLISDDLASELRHLLSREQDDGYNGCSSENYQLHRNKYQLLIDEFDNSYIEDHVGIDKETCDEQKQDVY